MSIKLWDFECQSCGLIFEDIVENDIDFIDCRECGKKAKKIFTPSGIYLGNQHSSWLPSVLEVVDRENPAPHVQEFIKNPTRKNYRRWMKKENLRPFDPGEKPKKPPQFDEARHHQKIWEAHRKRKRIEIHGR